MKTNFIHVGKRTLSVVLSIMMIVSTMLIGTITSVNGATLSSTGNTYIYFDPTGFIDSDGNSKDWWPVSENDGANWGCFRDSKDKDSWVKAIVIDSKHYALKVPSGSWTTLFLTRNSSSTSGSWDNVWTGNQTYGISLSTVDNYITTFKQKSSNTTWSKYVQSSNTSFSADVANVDTGDSVTFTTGLSSNSEYNSILSNSFSVTGGSSSDYTIDNSTGKITFNKAGTYKVTNNVTYNAKGFTNITGTTTTKEVTIDVTTPYVYLKNQANWSSVNAYFFNGSGQVGTAYPGDSMELVGTNESIYKIAIPVGATSVKFSQNADNTNNSGDLTLYKNKVYNNSSSTYKNWYSFDTTANYSVIGPVAGSTDWNTTTSVSEKVDDYGTYKLDVTITDPETQGFFRIKRDTQEYGPYNASSTGATNFDITATNTPASAYQASVDYHSKAFSISESGEYSIYVRNSYMKDNAAKENRPDVWVVRTGNIPVTNPTIKFGVCGVGGGLSAQSDGNTIFSDSTVTSGSSVVFTASPTDSTYTVEGWYSNADCTPDSKIIDAGTSTSYTISNVTSDTTVYVKFKSSSEPVGNAPVLHKYDPSASGTGSILDSGATDLLNEAMIYYTDSTYTYYYYDITDGGKYLYNITLDGVTYYKGVTDKYPNSVYMNNDWSKLTDIFETGHQIKHYYIIYTPSLEHDERISVVTELPNSSAPDTYKVTMNQGIKEGSLGTSYLDGDSNNKNITKKITDLTVSFTTETVENAYSDDTNLSYTGYMYQVYGYSILMTLDDDSKRVTSVVNSLVSSDSTRPIRGLGNGKYECNYTFPSNIKSAVVTPVFSVSDAYAKDKGITFTALYLKATPGDHFLTHNSNPVYEPAYYTWRSENKDVNFVNIGTEESPVNIEREPEGGFPGQTMLNIGKSSDGTDMYVAYVQSDLYGILFKAGEGVKTFDFNEFIKLQKLGYNNITFEPKPGVRDGIANTINTANASNGTVTYDNGTEYVIGETQINGQFELDVDIEGYYIDVFGNRIIDANGEEIKRTDVYTDTTMTVAEELAALNNKLAPDKKDSKIFGARYGEQDRANTTNDYGMAYAVYNYFVDGKTNKLISQQVSGYGTIEGAMSPNNTSITNAAYMASLGEANKLTYFKGTKDSPTKETFSSGYELIPKSYIGLPYLVSYCDDTSDSNMVDGKWYYMTSVPQITITVKSGLMTSEGTLVKENGKLVPQNEDTVGYATVNKIRDYDIIDQGTTATLRAENVGKHSFVGFYDETGTLLSTNNPYETIFGNHSTIFAVFKEVDEGTIAITHNVYTSVLKNPIPGGGDGKTSIKLIIKRKTETGYADPVEYTDVNNTIDNVKISDGDMYQIILTAERYGADTFLTFRQLEKDVNGNDYNTPLDDEKCLKVLQTDAKGRILKAEYTLYENEWNWYQQTGDAQVKNKTFKFFSDFNKTDINATLVYKYKDRYGTWQQYVVNNVPMDVNQINNDNYIPDNTLVSQYAPPIDEVFTSCEWRLSKVVARDSYAELEAIQELKKFDTYVLAGNKANPDYHKVEFNNNIRLETPKTITETINGVETTKKFSYWMRYLTDESGAYNENDGEIFSYNTTLDVRVTFNSYYKAIYDAVDVPKYYTNLQDAVYTREKYTNNEGKVVDNVYADFLVQFSSSDTQVSFKDLVKAENSGIKFGIALERNTKADPYDGTPEKFIAPKFDEPNVESSLLAIGGGLASGASGKGWSTATSGELYDYYYNVYDLTNITDSLTSLGRYDFIFRLDVNNAKNLSTIYNVYTYIIYPDENDSNNKKIVISKPKVMNIYEIGSKDVGEVTKGTQE